MDQPAVKCSKHRPSYFTPKIKFTDDENARLVDAVARLGTLDWHAVAQEVQTRNARQCRERWTNYLDPAVALQKPWTVEEDNLLRAQYAEIGARWKTLASFFPDRSTNNVKCRFISLERKGRRKNRANARNKDKGVPQATPLSDTSETDPLSFLDKIKEDYAFGPISGLDFWTDY
jgi:hypothetical protein